MSHVQKPIYVVAAAAASTRAGVPFAPRPAFAPRRAAPPCAEPPEMEPTRAERVREGLGDAFVLALGALPAAANAAIILTALGWRLV